MNFLTDTLQTLFQSVLVVAVPITAKLVADVLSAKAKQIETNMQNEKAKHYLTELENAVSAAVAQTSQRYVDGLKKAVRSILKIRKSHSQRQKKPLSGFFQVMQNHS
jgi:Na+-transporting methylmalonyl-CoA/oxaloacetate decarboxylase gamma subunit